MASKNEKGISVKYNPTQRIGVRGGCLIYQDATDLAVLPAGVYQSSQPYYDGQYVPGFMPVNVGNDEPLEVDPVVQSTLAEIEDFLAKGDSYKQYGFSHKRGYLFHGPPGCGKSSALRLIEKKFVEKYDGVVLIWGKSPKEFYEVFRKAEGAKRPFMLVCEDIDNMVQQFETYILEFLDGQAGLENFILIATTNNLSRIPDRIKARPSRIDQVIKIGMPDLSARRTYLKSIKVQEDLIDELAKRTSALSLAQVKEVVIAHLCLGESMDDAIGRMKKVDKNAMAGKMKTADDIEYIEQDEN